MNLSIESTPAATQSPAALGHLERLEAESIYILREIAAEAKNPVLMYSIGKDSAVLLHLAAKAFAPGRIPFTVLHIDTGWKFRSMIELRDRTAERLQLNLKVHTNLEGKVDGINPFDHGSVYTDVMKTEALKQALNEGGYDAAIGGARRDEEKSRAKERIFSFRSANHRWNPKAQRPELWDLYNAKINAGESIRVFPLSNWTELDIWQYIAAENIEVVPLYFAAERPVVARDGQLIMVDDERFRLQDGEVPMQKMVRFRTLGCYPLTAAIESEATDIRAVLRETQQTRLSERAGRLIDAQHNSSMERKKMEGYF